MLGVGQEAQVGGTIFKREEDFCFVPNRAKYQKGAWTHEVVQKTCTKDKDPPCASQTRCGAQGSKKACIAKEGHRAGSKARRRTD